MFDLDSYPYPVALPDDLNQNEAVDEDGDADEPDEEVLREGPRLLITEVMIRPSPPPHSHVELGEYIEVKNVGDEPIHPRDIVIEVLETNDRIYIDRLITSPEEEEAVSSIGLLYPGEYFLFLREDDPFYGITDVLAAGTYYEYGRWHRSISLSNFSRTLRLLEIKPNFTFEIHHEIGWRQGFLSDLEEISPIRLDIREDIAFGLRRGVEDPEAVGDPANWCYHLQRFSDGPLVGSPGRRTPDSCL